MPRPGCSATSRCRSSPRPRRGYWNLFDPQNGYTAIHRTALERLPLDRIAKRYEFENDLLIHLNILRVPARDVPFPRSTAPRSPGSG